MDMAICKEQLRGLSLNKGIFASAMQFYNPKNKLCSIPCLPSLPACYLLPDYCTLLIGTDNAGPRRRSRTNYYWPIRLRGGGVKSPVKVRVQPPVDLRKFVRQQHFSLVSSN